MTTMFHQNNINLFARITIINGIFNKTHTYVIILFQQLSFVSFQRCSTKSSFIIPTAAIGNKHAKSYLNFQPEKVSNEQVTAIIFQSHIFDSECGFIQTFFLPLSCSQVYLLKKCANFLHKYLKVYGQKIKILIG